MDIVGHGIDMVEVVRFADLLDRHERRLLDRVFTADERAYADDQSRRRNEHLAARFAAKEAALKALGTGWRDGIAWTDIEVVRHPSGQPQLRITGQAQAVADEMGVRSWHVSLSHTAGHAIASVIAVG